MSKCTDCGCTFVTVPEKPVLAHRCKWCEFDLTRKQRDSLQAEVADLKAKLEEREQVAYDLANKWQEARAALKAREDEIAKLQEEPTITLPTAPYKTLKLLELVEEYAALQKVAEAAGGLLRAGDFEFYGYREADRLRQALADWKGVK